MSFCVPTGWHHTNGWLGSSVFLSFLPIIPSTAYTPKQVLVFIQIEPFTLYTCKSMFMLQKLYGVAITCLVYASKQTKVPVQLTL